MTRSCQARKVGKFHYCNKRSFYTYVRHLENEEQHLGSESQGYICLGHIMKRKYFLHQVVLPPPSPSCADNTIMSEWYVRKWPSPVFVLSRLWGKHTVHVSQRKEIDTEGYVKPPPYSLFWYLFLVPMQILKLTRHSVVHESRVTVLPLWKKKDIPKQITTYFNSGV